MPRVKAGWISVLMMMVLARGAPGEEAAKHLFILSGGSNMQMLDPAQSFAPLVYKALGKKNVILVKDAEDNSSIADWYKEWEPSNHLEGEPLPWDKQTRPRGCLYDRLMQRVNEQVAGQSLKTITLVWMQGEADIQSKSGDGYAAGLEGLLEQLSSGLGRQDIHFVIGRVNDFVVSKPEVEKEGLAAAWISVRRAQQQVADANPRGAWVDTDDLNSGESPLPGKKGMQISDDVYCSVEGYVILGHRFAQAAMARINPATTGQAARAPAAVASRQTGEAKEGIRPASLFGHYMVLQRGMPVPVWGLAAPGQPVTVRFAGHAASTTAGQDGQWQVALPALTASAVGRELVIEGDNTIIFRDVLVGEVWVCSGQSNMQFGWGTESHSMYNWGGVPQLAALAEDARMRPIRTFNVPVNVSFTPNEDCQGKWVPGISGSAVAFGFSYYLQKELNVPVAVIVACWGSTGIEGWMPRDMADQLPHFMQALEMLDQPGCRTRVDKAIERGVRHGYTYIRQLPNIVYNGMLAPVIPYACRGMVWYQGEANAAKPLEYEASLPLWIKRLRSGWGRDDFEFIAVMLPGYGSDRGRPNEASWAWFRDVQMKILELPHTGVVNTIDLGDKKNIHPADKAPICERLALLTRSKVYGERILGQGPRYKGFTVKGSEMTAAFDYADGLKTTDGLAPKGFWLADQQGSWYPAQAVIKDDSVILKADALEVPVACRYAFSGKPEVNLVNKDQLPAYPFRTDTWDQ